MMIGSLLVIFFMLIYYRVSGVIADIAMVLNIIYQLAILAMLGATLTLPGIAGVVLTDAGLAVTLICTPPLTSDTSVSSPAARIRLPTGTGAGNRTLSSP